MTPVFRVIFGLVVLVLIAFAGDVGPIVRSYWLPSVSAFLLIVTSISLAWFGLVLRSLSAGSAVSCTCVLSSGGAQLSIVARSFLSCSLVSCVMRSLRPSPIDCCGLLSGLVVGVVGGLGESMY